MYLFIRALHVVCGAIWLGFAVFSALFLMPMAKDLGPDMAKVAASFERRKLMVFSPVIAGIAIVSGVWLYWRYTGGFSPEASRTHAAMAFGSGGLFAILAFMMGALVISRSMLHIQALMAEMPKTTNSAERSDLLADAETYRTRAAVATRIVALLVLATVILMSVANYL